LDESRLFRKFWSSAEEKRIYFRAQQMMDNTGIDKRFSQPSGPPYEMQ
jgi:hypothetical protein